MVSLFGRRDAATAEPKPKKEPKPRAAPTRLPVTQKACAAVVDFLNLVYQVSPWRDDALDEVEREALAKSLYGAAKSNVYLGNIIVRLTSATAEAQLITCVGAIVATRLAKHDVIPPVIGLFATATVAGIATGEAEAFTDAMGAGEPRGDHRQDGHGQDDVGGSPAQPAEVRVGVADEIGHLSLAEVQPHIPSIGERWGQAESGRVDPLPPPMPTRAPRRRVSSSDKDGLPSGGMDGVL